VQFLYTGLSVRPATPAEILKPYVSELNQVLVMTVEPGCGGQAFIPSMLDKIRMVREWFSGDIAVDGGINAQTAQLVCQAGANILVAGTHIFRHPDYREAIQALRVPFQLLRPNAEVDEYRDTSA
jgi:ribulose-phosphate 3-epimerase